MSTRAHATAEAKSHSEMAAVSRLSLWTNAIASSVRAATRITPVHLTQLTLDSLTMIRCRRASRAFCSEATISRCAVFWPSVRGVSVTASRRASFSAAGMTVSVAFPSAIAGHSRFTASSMCRRSRTRIRTWGSAGNEPVRRSTDRNALASRSTASLCTLGSVPDLCHEKSDQECEEQSHRGQEPGRYRLERLRASARRKREHHDVDHGGDDVQRREHGEGEPSGREVVEPAHLLTAEPYASAARGAVGRRRLAGPPQGGGRLE